MCHISTNNPSGSGLTRTFYQGRDLVYFMKKEGKLATKWTMGMVEEVQKGRDGILREVTIKYCNSSEQKLTLEGDTSNDRTMPRYTGKAVRKIVKIFSLEDFNPEHDIAEFRKNTQHMPAQ